MHVIGQSAPDIWRKLQKLDLGPQIPLPILLDTAFKVLHNWDEAENSRDSRDREKDRRKTQFMAAALVHALPTQPYPGTDPHMGRPHKMGPNVCFTCHQERHCSRACLSQTKLVPPGLCPLCIKEGHWKRDCPLTPQGRRPSPCHMGQKGTSSNQLPLTVTVDSELAATEPLF